MSRIKNELSKRNQYYVEKERYLELKHRCYQYAYWITEADEILHSTPNNDVKSTDPSDPTFVKAARRETLLNKAQQVRRLCEEAAPEAAYYLLACVTHGYSYDVLEARYGVLPCCRVIFYEHYRKFFWLLDKEVG